MPKRTRKRGSISRHSKFFARFRSQSVVTPGPGPISNTECGVLYPAASMEESHPVSSASNDPIGSTICAIDSYRRIAPSKCGHRRTLRSPVRHLLLGDLVVFPNRIRQASQAINHEGLRNENEDRCFDDDELFGLRNDTKRHDTRGSTR